MIDSLMECANHAMKRGLVTIAIAVIGALVITSAAGFAGAAIYMGLALHLPDYMAALCTAGGLFIVGVGILLYTRSPHRTSRNPATAHTSDHDPIIQIVQQATTAALAGTKKKPISTLLTAVALGVATGLLSPRDDR